DSRRPDHAGRVKLHHLRIPQLRSGLIGHGDPVACTFPGIRGDLVHAAPSASGDDDCFGPEENKAAIFTPVTEGATDSLTILDEASNRALHVHFGARMNAFVLKRANELETGPISHVGKPSITVRAKGTLHD